MELFAVCNVIFALSISFLLLQNLQLTASQDQPNLPFPNSFGSAGLGSVPNQLGTPINDGTTIPSFGDSSSDKPNQESQPGYQQQQQLGFPQKGTNMPFSVNTNNNNNNNIINNKQIPPNFSQLPFAVNNQKGSDDSNGFYNRAPGKSSLGTLLLVSLFMYMLLNFCVLP